MARSSTMTWPAGLALTLVVLLAALAGAPSAHAQKTPTSSLSTDTLSDDCLQIKPDWNFCSGWAGAYIDLKQTTNYATLWKKTNESQSITQTFDTRFRMWLRGEVSTMTGDSSPTYPSWFSSNFGCSNYKNSKQRYLLSMTCMTIISQSTRCSSKVATSLKSKIALCKSTCLNYVQGLQATYSDSAMCPGSNTKRADAVAAYQKSCNDATSAFGGADGSCVSGDTNEPGTCGYTEKSSVCDPSLCASGASSSICQSSSSSSSSSSSTTGGSSSSTTSSSGSTTGNAADASAVSESSSGLGMGAMIGIGVGVLVLIAAVVGFVVMRKRGAKNNAAAAKGMQDRRGSDNWGSAPPQSNMNNNQPMQQMGDKPGAYSMGPMPAKAPQGPANTGNGYYVNGDEPVPPYNGQQQQQQQQQQGYPPQQPQQQQFQQQPPAQQQYPQQQQPMSPQQPQSQFPQQQQFQQQPPQQQQQFPPQQQQQYPQQQPQQPYPPQQQTPAQFQQQQAPPQPPQQQSSGHSGMALAGAAVAGAVVGAGAVMAANAIANRDQTASPKPNKRVSSMMMSASLSRNLGKLTAASQPMPALPGNANAAAAPQDGQLDPDMPELQAPRYRAVRGYDPTQPDEMEIVEGDIIAIFDIFDDGWAQGTNLSTGQMGVLPMNFVEPYVEEVPHYEFRKSTYADPERFSMYYSHFQQQQQHDQPQQQAPQQQQSQPPQMQQPKQLDLAFDSAPLMDVSNMQFGDQQQQQQQQQQRAMDDSRQTAVPADPSSINALMAVLERISTDDQPQQGAADGQQAPAQGFSPETRKELEAKVSQLPPAVRESIISQHEQGRPFSFSALMNVLDDPQLQHHQSVYLDKKQGNRPDTLYSTYTFYEDMNGAGAGGSVPPLPSGGAAGTRPMSTLSDLDRWDAQLGYQSEEMNQELSKLRQQQGGTPQYGQQQQQQQQYQGYNQYQPR
ncbi:hypothetical protein AMAG_17689 [Allomyces macrogynus ATCC 38327]|uniref:SH3 domain-containing protein n=1 Tax=Allomyces macrogynus (strain ATCC 38327) TaxID=578462 RepID=A0A0L0RW59_ALLM3|nr:hypothetical protein AMAG_17689 [Allomyces macrogynus ATCC 38327]|eukprot:KNE54632.1 hypothetical protein AMAG_17689 [Allomyces macrogynus ATCC 38327]